MTALFESLLLMVIHDVYSVLTPTKLHFIQVGKPILDMGKQSSLLGGAINNKEHGV